MKYFFILSIILISLNGHTDQTDILAKARDHLIDQAIENVRNYCSDFLSSRSTDSTYICRLQIKEDCSRPSEKQKTACEVLRKVEDIEKQISLSDKNIAQIAPLPLYSSKPIIEEKNQTGDKISLNKPVYTPLGINLGSNVSGDLLKIRVDCGSDSDCKIQEYGKKACGGPAGTFVYSLRGNDNKDLLEEIAKYNKRSEELIKNSNLGSTCDWNGRTEPAKCIDKVCN